MILYVNDRGEIKDVNSTTQIGLTAIIVPEEENPFEGWSVARILCYKVFLDRDNNVGGYTPYIDSRIVEQLDKLGMVTETSEVEIADCNTALIETYEKTESNASEIADCNTALMELYEMMEV